MAELTIQTLKQICDKLPEDYTVTFETPKNTTYPISDRFEIDVEYQRLILKKR